MFWVVVIGTFYIIREIADEWAEWQIAKAYKMREELKNLINRIEAMENKLKE